MKLTKNERRILVEIFNASNGLFLFILHRQLNLSPKELFIAVENLKLNGFVEVADDRVVITKEGIGYSVQTPLKNNPTGDNINSIKEEYLGKKISINEFYIPQNFEK